MKNFDEKSIIFIFALTAIIVISYLPANAEEMDESTMEKMKATMNEMDEALMKEWESMMMMKEMDEMKTAMMQKEAIMEKGSIVSPRKQMAMGVAAEEVVCKEGLVLMIRSYAGAAVCVIPSTSTKLVDMGWATLVDVSMTRTGSMMDKESIMKSMINKMDEAMMKEWESMMKAKKMMTQAAETSISVSEEMNEDGSSMMKMGEFGGLAGHKGEGLAKIVSTGDKTYLILEDFEVTNGPDLYVYITQDGDVNKGINLGNLKGSMGNQNYELPYGIDTQMYNTAVIYCKLFGVYFAEATLA